MSAGAWTPAQGEHYRLEMHRHAEEAGRLQDENHQLREVLRWVATRYGETLAGRSVRDADECLERARLLLVDASSEQGES